MEVGEREIIYLSLHCHRHSDSCIKMGNDENHFTVSLIVSDKVTRQCPQATIVSKRKESRGPCAYQPNALPLSQTVTAILAVNFVINWHH